MSQENVEMVRRAIDAFNQRDLEAATRDNDPEVEVDWSRSRGVEAGIYRDEFIQWGEQVVVPNRARFRGRDGVEVEAHSALVVTIRNGRILGWRLFQERAEAFEAVGFAPHA